MELAYPTVDELLAAALPAWAPPPDLKVSEFADEHVIVPSGPLRSSRWQTSFMPYQAGILDAFFEPGIEIVVLQASSQVGKTSTALVWVAYHMVHDPCSILVVEPTVKPMAEDFSKNRLDPLIRASPVLSDIVAKRRQKDSTSTVFMKTFKGGSLAITGANSAASLAARDILLLILDEIDRYPPELPGEGATIAVAMKRTAAFRGRRRIALLSSPTIRGAPIDSWFHRGDQRRYHVPCPKCGYMHPYAWKQVRWDDDDPYTARLHCPDCDYPITDAERVAILQDGQWRAMNPERREREIASYHLWEAYSPLSSLASIVSGFLAAREAQKAGDKSLMHTWQNTTLGEAIEPEAGEGMESHVLLARREVYGVDAPQGVACVTMGVDVQDDRLETLIVGWGIGEESWLVDRHILPGDTSQPADGVKPGPWRDLDELLSRTYEHATGQRLSISATCIDSGGHRTERVYDYVARMGARRVFATKGRGGEGIPIVKSPSQRGWGRNRRKVPLYEIGTDAAKSIVMGRLHVEEHGWGYVHLPDADWCDDELAKQLTSERLMTKFSKGVPVQVWQQIRARNEMLDCYIMALAALRLLHPDLALLAQRLAGIDPPPAPPAPKRQSWLGPRRDSWLRRR